MLGSKPPVVPRRSPGGLAEGSAKLTSCLLGPALNVGQAFAKAPRRRAGHAELLPQACLKGPDAAPEGLGSCPHPLPKLAGCLTGNVLDLA